MSHTELSSDSSLRIKRAWKWLVGLVGMVTLILLLILDSACKRDSQDRSNHQLVPLPAPTPYFDARPAPNELVAEVKEMLSIIDSHTSTRTGSDYQIHVLVSKGAVFVPVGIQLTETDTGIPIKTTKLGFDPNLSCLEYPRDSKVYDWKDPRPHYDKGDSVAYSTELLTDTQAEKFAYYDKKLVNLVIEIGDDLFLIEGLEVTGQCRWFVE